MSVLGPLRAWAERCPDKLLYAFLDVEGRVTERYTYAELWARTTDIAAHIHASQRLRPGDRVLLAYPPGLEVICAFFAAVRLGLVPVPVYPPTSHGFAAARDKMSFIAQDCGASAMLTDRACYWSMQVNEARHRIRTWSWSRDAVSRLPWIVTTDAARGTDAEVPAAHSELLFLQYTSGSTCDPKGVMVTHANLLDNASAVVDHLPVGVSWLPQYHDMGLIGYYLFFALKGGTTYGFSPLDFIRRPALWLQTIHRYRGTASSAPNFAYEYCLRPGKLPPELFEDLDLTSLRFLMNAAEPVRPHVFRRFLDTFRPYGLSPEAFFSAYGLAELTLAVSNYGRRITRFDRQALQRHEVRPAEPGATEREAVTLVSCGQPLGSTEVRIVDADRDVTFAGGVGEIWLDGPSKCRGYFGRPELTEQIFGAILPGEPGRAWLRTGDLGFVHDDQLYLCGRTKDLIIVRGHNVYPQDVERLVEEDAAVRKGCVAAFAHDDGEREQVIVVAEVRDPRRLPDARAIAARVLELLSVGLDALVCIPARTIPKTSSGKIVRHRAREAWEAGELDVLATLRPDALPSPASPARAPLALAGFDAVLARHGVTGHETCTLPEAGLDSIQLVDFARELEEHLGATGHGALARAVDVQILQAIAICELCALLQDLIAARPHARLRFEQALRRLAQEHRALELQLVRRDAKLRFDPAHLPRTADGHQPRAVLLTGGTGFFGPFLLSSLLDQTDDDVFVLVRAEDGARGRERLTAGLPPSWAARVHPVCGDLARVNLGLTTERWGELAEQVRAIFHNGALVNYLYDYSAMREANVGGTNEVVRLAMSHRPKVLNHVSTTFVFGWSTKETLLETDEGGDLALLDFGYSQSKWAAEQVVRDAMRQGLAARIFRPALITPSVQGDGESFDISVRLLAFMLQHGLGTTAPNQVSFSPADVLADNLVAVCSDPATVGGTFHATRDSYASLRDVTEHLARLTGATFAYHDLTDFVDAVLARCGPDDLLFPLLDFFTRSQDKISAMSFKRYDNRAWQQARDASPRGRADPPLRDVVLGLLRFMARHGIVQAPEGGWD